MVTASARSGTATTKFNALPSLAVPASVGPTDAVPVSMTGYGASEKVTLSLDSGPVLATVIDDGFGSGAGTAPIDTTFGTHTLTATGVSSHATKSESLSVPGTLSLSPTEGLVGTKVSFSSEDGWVPGESIQLWLGSTKLQTVVADSAGSATGTFTIPQRQAGSVTIKLTDTVLGISATAAFDVVDAVCDPNFVPADAPNLGTRMAECPDGSAPIVALEARVDRHLDHERDPRQRERRSDRGAETHRRQAGPDRQQGWHERLDEVPREEVVESRELHHQGERDVGGRQPQE